MIHTVDWSSVSSRLLVTDVQGWFVTLLSVTLLQIFSNFIPMTALLLPSFLVKPLAPRKMTLMNYLLWHKGNCAASEHLSSSEHLHNCQSFCMHMSTGTSDIFIREKKTALLGELLKDLKKSFKYYIFHLNPCPSCNSFPTIWSLVQNLSRIFAHAKLLGDHCHRIPLCSLLVVVSIKFTANQKRSPTWSLLLIGLT